MTDELKDKVLALEEELIELRRDFHQYPEIGLQEKRTAGIVADYLSNLGMEVTTGVGQTGVVGLLKGKGAGKTLMLRADMDALPIQEQGDTIYRSKNDGVMHACGHDGHVAILLTVAKILSEYRHQFDGQIKFVFQPGEEGYNGAQLMIDDGVLESPSVDAVMGLHLSGMAHVGQIGAQTGAVMASSDVFTIRVLGENGHGAHPEGGIDAIYIGANVITSLQSLISREIPAQEPMVVHIGLIRGGTAGNIIADKVTMRASVRALNEKLRSTIHERLERIIKGITSAHRGSHELVYLGGVASVTNDEAIVDLVRSEAEKVVGLENVIKTKPTMGSDDMARFLEAAPGCYFFVGARNDEEGKSYPNHHPLYDIDEKSLAIGVETLSRASLTYLNSGSVSA
ncbi:MAG: amidohydrolase [Proteobacteria bacterium]|nr:amidohydrolase [Pseudomonadota bacterium]